MTIERVARVPWPAAGPLVLSGRVIREVTVYGITAEPVVRIQVPAEGKLIIEFKTNSEEGKRK